jgi:hypothetical protein
MFRDESLCKNVSLYGDPSPVPAHAPMCDIFPATFLKGSTHAPMCDIFPATFPRGSTQAPMCDISPATFPRGSTHAPMCDIFLFDAALRRAMCLAFAMVLISSVSMASFAEAPHQTGKTKENRMSSPPHDESNQKKKIYKTWDSIVGLQIFRSTSAPRRPRRESGWANGFCWPS